MPGYIAPEGEALRSFTNDLSKLYTGNNINRKNDIAFLKTMTAHTDAALLGAYVLKLKKTEFSYDTITSNVYGRFFKTGSELCTLLKQGMNINNLKLDQKNILSDKEALIYLNSLIKDLKSATSEKNAKTSVIDEEIKSVKSALLLRLAPIIENTLKRPPTQRYLLESFSNIYATYKKACHSDSKLTAWMGYKEKHEQYAKFIQIVNELDLIKEQFSGPTDEIKWPPNYTIRYGILLHIRNQIANEYKIRSAKNNSRLHDLCEAALNIQPDTVVPNEIQDVYLSDLRSFLARLRCNPGYIKMFEKLGLTNANQFLLNFEKDVTLELADLFNPQKDPEKKASAKFSNIVAWTAQFGFSMVSANVAARLFPGLSDNILQKTIGLIGLIYYGRKGEKILSTLGGQLESKVIGTVASVACAALNPVSALAGYFAGEALGIMIRMGEQGIQYITFNPNIFHNLEANISEQKWLQTLYDVLPEDKRKILLRVSDAINVEECIVENKLIDENRFVNKNLAHMYT